MSEKKRIVITMPGDLWIGTEEYARSLGYEVVRKPIKGKTPEDILASIEGSDAVVAGVMDHYTSEVIEKMEKPSVIARIGVGYDNVDVAAATKKGVAVTITPGANSVAVAELAVTMMLTLKRKLNHFDKVMHQGSNGGPGMPMTGTLYGATVGILGFGNIGKNVARMLSGFKCKILAYDPYLPESVFAEFGAIPATVEEIRNTCDVITIHMPLTDETAGMINKDFFAAMKRNAIFINCARGPLVNEQDLIDALKSGEIAGAGLDVFEHEPLETENELRNIETAILTPHTAAMTVQAFATMGSMAIDNIHQHLSGQVPASVVNPDCYRDGRRKQ